MDEREIRALTSAFCNDSRCAIARRGYGELWGSDFTTIKGLEARGYLQFESCHHDPFSRDFIRRSAITEAGLAELQRQCCPPSSAMQPEK